MCIENILDSENTRYQSGKFVWGTAKFGSHGFAKNVFITIIRKVTTVFSALLKLILA